MASTLALRIRNGAPESAVRDLVREAEESCPVCRALAGSVPMTVALVLEPPV